MNVAIVPKLPDFLQFHSNNKTITGKAKEPFNFKMFYIYSDSMHYESTFGFTGK